MRNLFLFIVAIVLVGCSSGRVRVVDGSSACCDTLHLERTAVSGQLLMPTRMVVSDGRIIVYHRKGDNVFTLISNPQSGADVVSCGFRGRGPEEFLGIDVQSIVPVRGGISCRDLDGSEKVVIFSDAGIDNVLKMEHDCAGDVLNGVALKDGFISANTMDDRSEFVKYSLTGGDPEYCGEYPSWTADTGMPLPFVYLKNMVAHPDGDRFAVFYAYFRKVRILDSNAELLEDIAVNVPDAFPPYSPDRAEQHIAYGSYPTAVGDCIYAMCVNSGYENLASSCPEIQVWDWKGNLLTRYIVDRHIDLFAIDVESNMLYALDAGDMDGLYHASL